MVLVLVFVILETYGVRRLYAVRTSTRGINNPVNCNVRRTVQCTT